MRVLLLRRAFRGGLASWADDLAARLPQHGFSVIVEDATWMPRETGKDIDRDVTRRLADMADSFDLIHAFGYRAAWACAEAFHDDYFWMYSAYEPPPENPGLIKRLQYSAMGFCASNHTRNALSGQGLSRLDVFYPGVGHGIGAKMGREETRKNLEIPDDVFVVGSFSDDGLVAAYESLPEGWGRLLLHEIDGAGVSHHPDVKRFSWASRPRDVMQACDLWVGANRDRGYVRSVAEAMHEGVPVLVRETMREMVDEDVSGFVFADDASLAKRIGEIREMELTRQTVGAAGRIRAAELFDVDARTADIARRYRDIVEDIL